MAHLRDQVEDLTEDLEILVRPHDPKRGNDQNRHYWDVLTQIAEQAWVWVDDPDAPGLQRHRQFSKESWAELFKREFIGVIELPNGEIVGISTTTLKRKEFADYMLKIEAYAAEMDVRFVDDHAGMKYFRELARAYREREQPKGIGHDK